MSEGLGRRLAVAGLSVAMLGGIALGVSGCESKPLQTATLDTAKLLQYDEEYQRLAQDYFSARMKLTLELQQAVSKSGGEIKDQATYDKFTKAENELNKEWIEKTRSYTEAKMAAVQQACEKLHQSKGIDLVLLDSPQHPAVEYGAIDISDDIMVELSGFASTAKGAAKSSGESVKTPAQEVDKASEAPADSAVAPSSSPGASAK